MLVDCAIYRDGTRIDDAGDVSGASERAAAEGAFAWIGLHEPSAEEFAAVTAEFHLHELLVEDALKAHQRAKIEQYGDVWFVVLKTAGYHNPDEVVVGEIQFIIGPAFLITIRHGHATPLTDLRAHLERDGRILELGPPAVLYAVADRVVDDYVLVIEELEVDVDEAEAAVFSDERLNPAERIFGLKRQVLELLRNVMPMSEVMTDLERADGLLRESPLQHYFRDVHDHLQRVLGRLELVRDLLTDALNANLAQVSVRQNNDMRTISAWAALIAAPTMLAGVWGMNFRNMPELDWAAGYPVAIGSMLVVVGLLWWQFKRSGWL
ncbi:MAG: Mg2 transporter protein CorA family protein [Ilumatobacteraceae bacterium]|nr:Mg2 transporter protein CorA family protein [Ilumatobacteraceae bacterium]